MSDFYDPNIATSGRGQRFDLAKAKEFPPRSRKGTIEPIFMASEQGLYGTRMVQSVLPMLEAIDIKPKVELIERAAWVQRLNARDFDMYDYNWWADLDPDETITPEFRTGEAWNYPGWSNKRFDDSSRRAGHARCLQAAGVLQGSLRHPHGRGADRYRCPHAGVQVSLAEGQGLPVHPRGQPQPAHGEPRVTTRKS